jgi:hypothetical protein
MDAGPIKSHAKPERIISGFFITLLLFLSPLPGQPPSDLMEELLWDRDLSRAGGADSVKPPMRAIVSSTYDDLYFNRISDTGRAGRVKEQSALSCPRLDAAFLLDRATWGCEAEGHAGGIRLDRRSDAEEYALSVNAPFNAVSGGGWVRLHDLSLSGDLGYDRGLSTPYTFDGKESATDRLLAILSDPRFMHSFSAAYSFPPFSFGLYEKRQPFLSALSRVEKQLNRSSIELPLASADQEFGAYETIRAGQDTCGIAIGVIRTTSDTGPAGNAALPIKIAGDGDFLTIDLAAQSLPGFPWMHLSWQRRTIQLRGYDGNAPVPYCYLDSNRFIHARFETGFTLPWKLNNSVFFESATLGSVIHGRFDPYPFSAFTIFDPVKYRLDTFGIRYRSAGAAVGRAFSAFRRGRALTRLTVAWLELEGSLATREYDFSYVIPRLINPRSWSLADEHRLLITPEAMYSFQWAGLICTGSLRQIIPLDIANIGKRGAANAGASSTKRSVRGGTTVRVSVEYRL